MEQETQHNADKSQCSRAVLCKTDQADSGCAFRLVENLTCCTSLCSGPVLASAKRRGTVFAKMKDRGARDATYAKSSCAALG